ncbi:MAG: VOC family protein [Novosphingobium sp.]|nr:VOC family protein [Novosphingobium sp.]
MGLLAFSFTKLVVGDLDAAAKFYGEVIGLKEITRTTATSSEYAQDEVIMSASGRNDGPMLLLVKYLKKPAPPTGGAWTGFIVDDLDARVATALAAGGKELVPAFHQEENRLSAAIIADPEGHVIELVQMDA